ncbi:MAG: HipA domain-containing protein [Polyangiaceae bacterium]
MDDARELDVLLGEVPVGRLSLEEGGLSSFVFFDSYRTRYPRPVLGQMFEDDLSGRYAGKGRLPVWFSNLLPEGPLRDQVQTDLGRKRRHEMAMLAALAEDLPGAVRMAPASSDASVTAEAVYETEGTLRDRSTRRIRFSLAGVQLKLSVLREQKGTVTLPVRGVDGDWILKLPDRQLPGVPTNEHAMMTWARLSQLDVPEVHLVSAAELENIDASLFARDEPAYLIRRFDRGPGGQRIHIEDMAQVLGLYSDDKYSRYHYLTIARVVRATAGEPGFDELIRRLVFMVASGNADMHHKNWSLIYPDAVRCELAPAYDFVSTVAYSEVSDELALKLAGSRRWEEVRLSSFEALAVDAGADRLHTRALVEETIAAIVQSRAEARALSRAPSEVWDRIDAHWRRTPLLRSHAEGAGKTSLRTEG